MWGKDGTSFSSQNEFRFDSLVIYISQNIPPKNYVYLVSNLSISIITRILLSFQPHCWLIQLYVYSLHSFKKRHLLVIFFTRMKQWWLINKKIAKALLMVTIYQLSPEVWPWCVQSRLILTKILILKCVLTILTYLVSFLYWYVGLIKRCSLQLFTQKFIIY